MNSFLQTLSNHPPFTPSDDQYVVSLLKTLHAKTHPRRFQPTKPPVHNLHLYLCYSKTNKKCHCFSIGPPGMSSCCIGLPEWTGWSNKGDLGDRAEIEGPKLSFKKRHSRSWSLAGKFLSSEVSRNFLDIFFLLILSDVKRDFGNGFDPASRWSLHLGCNDLWYGPLESKDGPHDGLHQHLTGNLFLMCVLQYIYKTRLGILCRILQVWSIFLDEQDLQFDHFQQQNMCFEFYEPLLFHALVSWMALLIIAQCFFWVCWGYPGCCPGFPTSEHGSAMAVKGSE